MKPNPSWRGDPTFLPELFKHFGIDFKELPGWEFWGMGDFSSIQGVFWYHTGSRNTSAQYIARNAGLGGELSSLLHIAPDGTPTFCGIGIAYHAGRGNGHGWATNNANPVSLGFEMQHNGTDTWDERQLDTARRASAVILWFLGHPATIKHMIGHWEYSMAAQGKWDPGRGNGVAGAVMDMNRQRALVQQHIDNINKYGQLDAPAVVPPKEITVTYDQFTKFITGYVSGFFKPWFDTWEQTWTQLRGPEGKGWTQLGKNAKGQDLSLVDGVAATRQDIAVTRQELAAVHQKLDQILEGK